MQNYGVSTLTYANGQQVGSRSQAKELAAFNSGQSYNQGKDYNKAVKARKESGRYGNTKNMEIQEGQRTSSAY